MAAPIGPGDWVECVDNTPRPWHFGPYIEALEELRVGGVYQVRAIDRAGDLFLVGIPSGAERLGVGPDALGFDESRFRLIYRPKADLIESLLAPAPPVETVKTLHLTGHLDGQALRFVGPGSDEIVSTFRTFDEAAAAMRAAREALPQLAATLAKPSQQEGAR